MANTLNLGNGNWATKKDSLLAYNSENRNFKPLPFDFTRASSATVVNKAGLIETVGSGEPRIDFKDNTKGALKLEPTRSNLVTYSEDFTQWSYKTGISVTSNEIISVDGALNGSKIETTASGSRYVGNNYTLSTGDNTFSVFAKKGVNNWVYLNVVKDGTNNWNYTFDLENGLIGQSNSSAYTVTPKIEYYGNGWYRCSITANVTTAGIFTARIYCADSATDVSTIVGSNVYIYGAQLEQGSYATSYIPTSGSAVTRVADVCNNGGNEQVFNDSEGVLYLETKGFIDVPSSSEYIQLSKNGESSATNSLVVQHRNNGYLRIYVNGFGNADIHFNINIDFTENHKIAVLYKLNGYKLFIDGVSQSLFGTPTQTVFSGLNDLSFNLRGALHWNGSIKDARVYNTALTDAELIALTKI